MSLFKHLTGSVGGAFCESFADASKASRSPLVHPLGNTPFVAITIGVIMRSG